MNENMLALANFITAVQAIAQIYDKGTDFTDKILPSITEEFLIQSSKKFDEIKMALEVL